METYKGYRIKELMAEQGMNMATMKDAIGLQDHLTMVKYVNGSDSIKVSRLLQVAKALHVSVLEFFSTEENTDSTSPPQKTDAQLDMPLLYTDRIISMQRDFHEKEMEWLRKIENMKLDYERQLWELQRENEVLRSRAEKNSDAKCPDNLSPCISMIGYDTETEPIPNAAEETSKL
ncbi:MAG: helix-turn-helix transcriptional regulator [Bacteroidaceae bacterium]|nr:helix-turn-helix transcriptional regulator [Bacteroidaceae bacterium]